MEQPKHPLLIKNPELQNSREVNRAVKGHERDTGEKVPNNPAERIEIYLKRLENLVLDPENKQKKKGLNDILHTERPRALRTLRRMILNEYIRPNKKKMAEAAARVEERAAHQMGIADVEYGEEQLEQRGEIAVGDLESSLDQWITYLSDPTESYPVWFRYYAFRNILDFGEYDKDKQELPKRSKGTFKLFPDVDRGALAYIQEMIEASQDDNVLSRVREAQKVLWDTPEENLLTKEKAKAFANLSFAKQYADGIRQNGDISPELRAETRGEWVLYKQGSDPTPLWLSLQNKGAAWCTKGYPTAETQLKNGDFYVYYTLDATGNPTIPRIAIRMEGDKKIAENPRGVFDTQQNLEPNMADILEEKLKEFGPEADRFRKKSEDMKRMTALEKKQKNGEDFTRDDLVFLYEIDTQIEGFGYGDGRDPRVDELRRTRNAEGDMLVVFECAKEQIAHSVDELDENTRAYIGKWNVDIYQRIIQFPNIKHFYYSFPEDQIFMQTLETDQTIQTSGQVRTKLEEKSIDIDELAEVILNKTEFSKIKKKYELVRFFVRELGFAKGATIEEIFKKAKEAGLSLCPAEIGPQLILSRFVQSQGNLSIAMEPIFVRGEGHCIFELFFNGDNHELYADDVLPFLNSDCAFIFCRARE